MRRLAVSLAILLIGGPASDSSAQGIPAGCYEVCAAPCLKPLTIPDRWDDQSLVPGWPVWQQNKSWDCERFTDTNGNKIWDPGEPFVDGVDRQGRLGTQDGQFSSELYDPQATGYLASLDLGLELTLKEGLPSGASLATQYYPIEIPIPGPPDEGAGTFRWNLANCNSTILGPGDALWTENGGMTGPTVQGCRDLIAQDPTAYWEPACQCVESPTSTASPRIFVLPIHDPRIALSPGSQTVHVVKLAGFFIETIAGNGDLFGRLVIVNSPGGIACVGPYGFLYDCPVETRAATWGQVKASYR